MSHYRRRMRLLFAATLTVTAACGGGRPAGRMSTVPSQSSIRVSVKNEFGFPVTVHATGSGATWKLGSVMPATIRDFTVPNALAASGPVEFIVSGHGNSPVRSGPLLLAAGRVVDFTVARPLHASTAILRP